MGYEFIGDIMDMLLDNFYNSYELDNSIHQKRKSKKKKEINKMYMEYEREKYENTKEVYNYRREIGNW